MLAQFLNKYKYYILTLIIGILIGKLLFSYNKKPEVITQTVTKEIIVHDTITVNDVVEVVKYVHIKDPVITHIDTTYIDSLYKNFAEQIKQGNIPVVEDTQYFAKDYLEVKYKFPPLSKFEYKFLAAPDTIITNTITKTREIDKTPKLSLFGGIISEYNNNHTLSNFGMIVGVKYKRIGLQTNIYQRSKNIGIFYSWPR